MQRWYDSISPWRMQSNVQRSLRFIDNREWANSLLLDYLSSKPMHMQQLSILWIVIIIIIHSKKWLRLQNSVLPDKHGTQWEQYHNLWSIINITFFTLSICYSCWISLRIIDVSRLLCLCTIFKLLECLNGILERIENFEECQTCFHSSLNRLYQMLCFVSPNYVHDIRRLEVNNITNRSDNSSTHWISR